MKEQIRALRIKSGLSQTEIAMELGYGSGAIVTMWESGARKPPSDKLPALAKILNCTIDDLYAESHDAHEAN